MLNNLYEIAYSKIDEVSKTCDEKEEFTKQYELLKNSIDSLKKTLTKEQKEMFEDIDSHMNTYNALFEVDLYIQGLKDGFELKKILSK